MTNQDRTISAPNAKDLQPLIDHIEKYYGGNVLLLTEWLDRAIYMIPFIPENDEFTILQKRNVCGAIFGIKESLIKAYFKLNEWDYEDFD